MIDRHQSLQTSPPALPPWPRSVTFLKPLTSAIDRLAGGTVFALPDGRRVVEITHTELSKDDPFHRHHALACDLAAIAVRDIWREMDRAWKAGIKPAGPGLPGTRFTALLDRYLNHPEATATQGWWKPLIGGATAPKSSPPQPTPPPSDLPRRFRRRQPPRPLRRAPGEQSATLRRSATDPAVRSLQRRLNLLMPRGTAHLVVAGRFGPRTQAVVRTFQRSRRLTQDGGVGPLTWRALRRE